MPPDETATDARRPKGSTTAERGARADFLAFTIEAGTGRIVKIECVNASGERLELSDEERGRLESQQALPNLERIIEQAFEAGIDCVLGDEATKDESRDDAELSRVLLRSLIERSDARRLLQRDVLSAAIAGTLIEQAAAFRAAAPGSAAAH